MSDLEGISENSCCISEPSQNYQDFKEDEISLNNTYAVGATPVN